MQKEIKYARPRKFWRAAKSAIPSIVLLLKLLVAFGQYRSVQIGATAGRRHLLSENLTELFAGLAQFLGSTHPSFLDSCQDVSKVARGNVGGAEKWLQVRRQK